MAEPEPPANKNPADTGRELRARMLTTPPKEMGIEPSESFPRVYGVLMDWPMWGQTVTVISLCDGSASTYTTSMFGVIGGIDHEPIRAAAQRFVAAAGKHLDSALPTRDYPYPQAGQIRFYLACFDGVRVIQVEETALKTGRHPCSDLWNEGQRVMAALRVTAQGVKEKHPRQ
jgi:hypothetical protein